MADPSGGGDQVIMREYRKGNWTVSETLVLIEAKKMDEERRSIGPHRPETELRWKWIEEYCWRKECLRNQNQCNDRWDNLMRVYKKIRVYERWRLESSFNTGSSSAAASYFKMEKIERKEKNLPSNMLPQIYEALAELVDKKSLPSSSSSAAAAVGNGNGNGGQILRICQHSLGFVAPVMQHQVPATIVLPLPPQLALVLSHPPPPQPQPPPPPPPPTFHVEPIQPTVDTSLAKRRRTMPRETTAGGERESEEIAVGAALSRSASLIAQVIRESDERRERSHKEVVRLQERRLEIEESKADISRKGMNGVVDAINKLAASIFTLASSSSSSCHNNQNHQGGAK